PAKKAGKDPIAFRRQMLAKQPRLLAALELVAEKSDWGKPLPARVGRGVCVQPSFASFIATVAEAEGDEHGEVRLRPRRRPFGGGAAWVLSDYHAADPTGVPAELASADLVKRGEYLTRAAD